MILEIYISNLSEDIWDFITTLSPASREFEINENAFLSDRDLFALNSRYQTIAILPSPVDQSFLEYYQELFQKKNISVWVPTQHTGQTCLDFIHDAGLMKRLDAIDRQTVIQLSSYATTSQFLMVVDTLRNMGFTVKTPESPSHENAWTVNAFGTKTGIRQVTCQLGGTKKPWMVDGQMSFGLEQTARLAAHRYCAEGGVVLKTYKAHSGAGVSIFSPGKLSNDYSTCYQQILEHLMAEKYWSVFPVVVEQFVQIDPSVGGGNPNCEYAIRANGEVELLYVCGMRVTAKGVFKGIEVGANVLPKKVLNEMLQKGKKLGKWYRDNGYKGFFDVDCVYSKKKKLFITESNVRRTGGTHVYKTARALFGEKFLKNVFLLSDNSFSLPKTHIYTFSQLRQKLQPILYQKSKGEGVIIAAANPLQQQVLTQIIVGKTRQRALAIEKQLESFVR